MVPLVALEEHYVSTAVTQAQTVDPYATFPPHIPLKLKNVGDGRIKDLDNGKISLQIISHGPGIRPPALCTEANDELAAAIAKNPTRLGGLAMLPMNDPADAAKELERSVKDLKFVGALVDNHVHGEFYDDERFWPFFEKAVELDVAIYIHPSMPADKKHYEGNYSPKVSLALSAFGWGWHSETALSLLRLFASGFFDQPFRSFDPSSKGLPSIQHSSRFRNVSELSKIPGKIVVIGGGISGSEAASQAAFQISNAKHSPGKEKPVHAESKVYHIFNRPFSSCDI